MLSRRLRRRFGGFTLIEMLVVIIIIGILLAIGIPAYLQYQSKAKDAAAKADLTTAFKALAATKTMNNGSFPNQSSMLAQARTDEPGMSLLSGLSSSAATGKINVNLTGTTLTLATLSKSGKVITLTASSSDGFSQPAYTVSTPPVGYSVAVLADAPFGYWRLDESAGTAVVNSGSSGAADNFTYGCVPWSTPASFSSNAGTCGSDYPTLAVASNSSDGDKSVTLHHVTNYSTATMAAGADFESANFSVDGWVYLPSASTNAAVIGNADGGGKGWQLATSGGNFTLNIIATGVCTKGLLAAGWNYIGASWDNSTHTAICAVGNTTNGFTSTSTVSGGVNYVPQAQYAGWNAYIGSNPVMTTAQDGVGVDDLAYYKTTLTAARLQAHYTGR